MEFTPREEDPQMEVSGGTVIIAIPGATPKEIKNIVVQPLERRMKEIKGVENVYGIASENVGIINVQYFEYCYSCETDNIYTILYACKLDTKRFYLLIYRRKIKIWN